MDRDWDNFTHKGSYSHVPGYAEINFQQGLDGDGWELDQEPDLIGKPGSFSRRIMGQSLVYRRGNEWASVPNMPYNQPAEWRVKSLLWEAERCEEGAARHDAAAEREPWRAHDAEYNRKQAERLREEAARLQREGNGKTIRRSF